MFAIRRILLLFFLVETTLPVALVAAPLPLADHGQTTYDPNTGLSWLDVNLTLDLSYEYVTAYLIGSGQPYAGYRYATAEDIFQLLADINATVGFTFPSDPNVQSLISLLGPPSFVPYDIHGLYSKPPALGFTTYAYFTDNGGHRTDVFVQDNPDYPINMHQFDLGSFLVTDLTTPLPPALPLFATALGVLGVLGWRRKRKIALAAA